MASALCTAPTTVPSYSTILKGTTEPEEPIQNKIRKGFSEHHLQECGPNELAYLEKHSPALFHKYKATYQDLRRAKLSSSKTPSFSERESELKFTFFKLDEGTDRDTLKVALEKRFNRAPATFVQAIEKDTRYKHRFHVVFADSLYKREIAINGMTVGNTIIKGRGHQPQKMSVFLPNIPYLMPLDDLTFYFLPHRVLDHRYRKDSDGIVTEGRHVLLVKHPEYPIPDTIRDWDTNEVYHVVYPGKPKRAQQTEEDEALVPAAAASDTATPPQAQEPDNNIQSVVETVTVLSQGESPSPPHEGAPPCHDIECAKEIISSSQEVESGDKPPAVAEKTLPVTPVPEHGTTPMARRTRLAVSKTNAPSGTGPLAITKGIQSVVATPQGVPEVQPKRKKKRRKPKVLSQWDTLHPSSPTGVRM